MVEVKVLEDFRDRTADLVLRKKDETLVVPEERAKKLEGLGLVTMIGKEPESENLENEDAAETEMPKKSSKKKG